MNVSPLSAENAVIACLLYDSKRITEIPFLKPDSFSFEANASIFRVMEKLNGVADPVRIEAESGVSISYMSELLTKNSSSINLEHYAEIVHNAYQLNSLSSLCQRTIEMIVPESNVDEVMDYFEANSYKLSTTRKTGNEPVDIAEPAKEAMKCFIRIATGEMVRGVQTGMSRLDDLLGGFRNGEIIIVAARPGCGKTALLLNFADHLIRNDIPVLMFSLEMSKEQLAQRLMQIRGEVCIKRLAYKPTMPEYLKRAELACTDISKNPLAIDDNPHQTINSIRSISRRWKSRHATGVILVDYLQLIQPSKDDARQPRYVALGNISAGLKQLARELNCPVISAAQLGRTAAAEKSIFAMTAHLRESGNLEQDADAIIILARQDGEDGQPVADNVLQIGLTKNRNGPTGEFDGSFDKSTQRIKCLEDLQAQVKSVVKTYADMSAYDPVEYKEHDDTILEPDEDGVLF